MTVHTTGFEQVTPDSVNQRLARGESFLFIDVREPLEHRIAQVPAAQLIPLGEFVGAVDRFEPHEDIVVICHHGIRSARACEYLAQQGFTRVFNVAGGIDRWSMEVDPTIPRY